MAKQNYTQTVDVYLEAVQKQLDLLDRDEINIFLQALVEARNSGRLVFIMGNGGSAATASHFVCDFNKGLSNGRDKDFRFICLNDNVPTVMALANDLGYEHVFVEQLKGMMRPGDLVVGISGSGNSANVVNALAWANENGGKTMALVGYDGGELKKIAACCVHVAVNDMQVVEDVHMILDHMAMRVLGQAGKEVDAA